jgi:hypothetical protein
VGVVGLGVVGEGALDRDPLLCVPACCAFEEAGAVVLAVCGEDLAVGEPGVVVDCDVEMVPAGVA